MQGRTREFVSAGTKEGVHPQRGSPGLGLEEKSPETRNSLHAENSPDCHEFCIVSVGILEGDMSPLSPSLRPWIKARRMSRGWTAVYLIMTRDWTEVDTTAASSLTLRPSDDLLLLWQ